MSGQNRAKVLKLIYEKLQVNLFISLSRSSVGGG